VTVFASVVTYLLLGALVAADLHREMRDAGLREHRGYPIVGWPLFLALVTLLWPIQVLARAVGALMRLVRRSTK
jgi:hypothetical protein